MRILLPIDGFGPLSQELHVARRPDAPGLADAAPSRKHEGITAEVAAGGRVLAAGTLRPLASLRPEGASP